MGEWIWPQSRWSIFPLVVLWLAGAVGIRRQLREAETGTSA
jgi:hypothetical protein